MWEARDAELGLRSGRDCGKDQSWVWELAKVLERWGSSVPVGRGHGTWKGWALGLKTDGGTTRTAG